MNQDLLKHNQAFREFLRGKSVSIVGPAESVRYHNNNNIIQNSDLIVRINQGTQQAKKNATISGNKTDILYNSLDFDPMSGGNLLELIDKEIKFICCPYSQEEQTYNNIIFNKIFDSSLFERFKIRFIEKDIYDSIKTQTNSRINSGLGAIVDLLSFEISSLFITGIDFYRSYYCDDYCSARNRINSKLELEKELEFKVYDDNRHHNPDRQYAYFKNIITKDTRVLLDPFMQEIIKDNRYDKWDTIPRRYNE